ncbi:DUF1491 family protein [Pseudokordiimonas caeni]|uniref:DUF1491 family protein n=1 Tax=Pseudokordiimonas caeni TaxID=2997908 RepID=UPI002810DD4E|nr:DUF1491 family protein [Pseudokordiimonas caeni]
MQSYRLPSALHASAIVRTAFACDRPAYVVHKGDAERGGLLLKVNRFAKGVWLLERAVDFDGNAVWRPLGADDQSEAAADERVAKRRQMDSDLWIVEVEDRDASFEPDAPVERL